MREEQKEIQTLSKEIILLSDRIQKLRQDKQNETEIIAQHLAQMNIILAELIKVSESGSTVAAGKKIVPFHTGSQEVGQLLIPPTNPDDYPTRVDVYAINSNRVIPHMTLINDGPGDIFFINAYAKNVFNEKEGQLHVNDQRELFNVYEIRLRSTLPLTTFRLIEGIFRTGSFAPNTIANVENRPTVQPNQILKTFVSVFDIDAPITVTSPTVQTIPTINFPLVFQPPLPPGATATLVDAATNLPMPFTIPEGFVADAFSIFGNSSTDFTVRGYLEFIPGTLSETIVAPASNRGVIFNLVLNLSGQFTSRVVDPLGAPVGGRKLMLTITNDDPFNNLIGSVFTLITLSRIT